MKATKITAALLILLGSMAADSEGVYGWAAMAAVLIGATMALTTLKRKENKQ